jgi:hypothetical protein
MLHLLVSETIIEKHGNTKQKEAILNILKKHKQASNCGFHIYHGKKNHTEHNQGYRLQKLTGSLTNGGS